MGRPINAAPPMPPLKDQIKDLIRTVPEMVKHVIVTGEVVAPLDKVTVRRSICYSCDKRSDSRCSLCGCFTDALTKLSAAKCRAGKW